MLRVRADMKCSKLESATRPHPKPVLPKCKLRLICNNLDHEGSSIFFDNINPTVSLSQAVDAVLSILYQPTKTNNHIPPTRSVSLTLRSMGGVAYTTGSDIDDDHKEIHFSLDYIKNIASDRHQQEIQGVLVHEMVHCWQWNGLGTSPGGLIEGIADFVRLKAGLSPPHWKKEAGGEWDAGYQHTGYFLEWIEESFGEGSVKKINATLQNKKYVEEEFWQGLFQKNVADLWAEYSNTLPKPKERDENTKANIDEEMKAHDSKSVT